MAVHRTLYALNDNVTAYDRMRNQKYAPFTVDAIRIDETGVSYLLRGEKREFPDHETREWCKEADIQPVREMLK